MNKQNFFFKLIPPRPTFPYDMTEEERRLMSEHVAYTQELFNARKVLIFGPVLAPGAPFGIGVFEVSDEAEAKQICEGDPTVRAGLNRFELYPMRVGAAQGREV